MSREPLTVWYQNGLRFQCTGCGQCCTGSPGVVWISEEEIQKLAEFLHISVETVTKRYIRKLGDRLALVEQPPRQGQYDCVFLKDNRCSIYSVRPKQCKTFPWWKENLSSPQAWEEAGKQCEGINHKDAPLVSFYEIMEQNQ